MLQWRPLQSAGDELMTILTCYELMNRLQVHYMTRDYIWLTAMAYDTP